MSDNTNTKKHRILITGVHSTPAIAVLEELQDRGYSDFVWVGQKHSIIGNKNTTMEYRFITERNIPFINLITGKIQRTIDLSFFLWMVRLPVGFFQSFTILLKYKPSLVLTFGSHVGVPISFWAWVLRIPIVDHEQTTTRGLATQVISRFATKVCFSWRTSHKESEKFIYTGNPIKKNNLTATTDDIKFGDKSKRTLLILGGNQGSHKLNLIIFATLKKLLEHYNVIHQTGSNPIADDLSHANKLADKYNVDGIKYIPMQNYSNGEVFAKSDILISRCGANSIGEIAALGKLALLIPIPFTYQDEQTKNAQMLVKAGVAKMLHQEVLTPDTLLNALEDINKNYDNMMLNVPKAKALIEMDADKNIANIVEKQLELVKEKTVTKETSQPKESIIETVSTDTKKEETVEVQETLPEVVAPPITTEAVESISEVKEVKQDDVKDTNTEQKKEYDQLTYLDDNSQKESSIPAPSTPNAFVTSLKNTFQNIKTSMKKMMEKKEKTSREPVAENNTVAETVSDNTQAPKSEDKTEESKKEETK